MADDYSTRLSAVDLSVLTPLVRKALDNDALEVLDWSYQRLTGGATEEIGTCQGICRFTGNARLLEDNVPWSLILKATGKSPEHSSDVPSDSMYWKREALAYQTGLLEDLPGDLVAPRCFGLVEHPGDEFWIWLEDVFEGEDTWSLERYGLAARHLGQFNGAYLVDHPLPDLSWLSSGRVLEWFEEGAPTIKDLPNLVENPFVQRWFGEDNIARHLNLLAARNRMIEAIDRLPRTFCHHDAFRRNLMARVADDGHEQTAAIDWAYTGIGAVGEEIGTLVSVGIQFMEVDVAQAVDLDEVVFEGYLAGLHDAGWRGDPRLVRLGFAATSALFMGIGGAGGCLQFILADDGKMIENVVGYPIDQILDQWAIMQNYLLDLGDEALMLIDKIG